METNLVVDPPQNFSMQVQYRNFRDTGHRIVNNQELDRTVFFRAIACMHTRTLTVIVAYLTNRSPGTTVL